MDVFPNFESRIAALQDANTAATAARTDLQNQINNIKMADRLLFGGQLFTAAVDLPLRCAVRFNGTGQLIPATDAAADGGAIGMVDALVPAGGTTVIYGAGATFSDIGLSGVTDGTRIFLGTNGAFSLSSTGAPRLIQAVGMMIGGNFRFDFRTAGIWVAS